ncbi:MAG: hypothetical protein NMNS01_01930 [Nitrosomonas sp.]|jgi:DNA-binding response OmpR family regulator|nr:MAG: hypothetical protein NMNS01_01930 [Nitrosomonas sp.]
MHVLIIEDNQDTATSVNEFLKALGYTVDVANNGITGLQLAITKNYSVIILDLNLPGIDGFEICRQLRQTARRQIPVLMLTAKTSLENKLEGFNSGADDYLTKPFSLRELAARVRLLTGYINCTPIL